MSKAVWREFYKLNHRKSTWCSIIIMMAFMLVIGMMMGRSYGNLLVMSTYNSSQIIMLIMVVVGSMIFTGEFQSETILPLIFRSPNRSVIFFAKYFTLFLYEVILHIIAIVFTIFLNVSGLISNRVSLSAVYKYHQSLLMNMLSTTLIDVVLTAMMIGMICVVACLFKSELISVLVNALLVLVGGGFSANLMEANNGLSKIIRWNPLNMTYLTPEYYNYASYHGTSMLSTNQLLLGTFCYMCLFGWLGWLIFEKKHF